MANLSKVIYINEEDYSTILNGGTITKGGVTYSHDPTALYVIKNVSAPEYAETAGYATTAGQATKATQDGGGNVISETYAKKIIIGTLTNNNNVWSCDRTYSQLASAILAGDVVLLREYNSVYYPRRYPYLDNNDNITGDIIFRSIGGIGNVIEVIISDDNTIEYSEYDLESEWGEYGYIHQRTVLRLTIGQNNILTFKDYNNNSVSTSDAKYWLTDKSNWRDVVIQYNDREYRKQVYKSDNSCIAFVSVDLENYLLYYLSFDCSTSNTVTLIENTSIPIISENVDLGQAYGISSDNSNSAVRTSSISGFKLKKGGIVAIKFTTDINITNPGLNISSTGAKSMYYRGSTLLRGTVNAGDTVTFIYDGTYYHIISIDKDIDDAKPFIVTATDPQETGDEEDFVINKTFAEITEAFNSGRTVVLVTPSNLIYYLAVCRPSYIEFRYVSNDGVDTEIRTFSLDNTNALEVSRLYLNQVAYTGDYNDLTNKPIIPAAITIDSTITQSGTNPVRGSAIYSALAEKMQRVVINMEKNNNVLTFTDADDNALTHAQVRELLNNPQNYVILNYDDLSYPPAYSTWDDGYWEFERVTMTSDRTINIGWDDGIYLDEIAYELLTRDYIDYLVPTTRKVNNKPLSSDITLTASDVGALPSSTHIPSDLKVGSVAGKLYRNDVNGGGNFTVKGNSGCIPNLIAGTFLVSIYAKSTTQSYTFKFNFGSVSYNLSTTNGEINDVREITIPSSGTFSGSVLNGSVAPGTILYVVMYDYLTPVSTVGVAAVTNRYSDLDGTPNIPTVNNGTLTIQQNGITAGTFTANQSSNTTANIYSTMFGIKGQTGFERDTYNSSSGTWSGVEIVTPDPLVTYIDISNNKLYRYDPITTNYVDLGSSGSGNITSTAITNLTDIL